MYTYSQIKDKTKQGIEKELSEGIAKACVYFYETLGFPIETFKEKIEAMNRAEQLLWYMSFRSENPKLFNSNK